MGVVEWVAVLGLACNAAVFAVSLLTRASVAELAVRFEEKLASKADRTEVAALQQSLILRRGE